MESDTFYKDFIENLIWRLSGNLNYYAFSMKTSDILHKFSILLRKSPFLPVF